MQAGNDKSCAMDGVPVTLPRDIQSSARMWHVGDVTQISANTDLNFTVDLDPSTNLSITFAS